MTVDLLCRDSFVEDVEGLTEDEAIERGRELRKKGHRVSSYPILGGPEVTTPSGEAFQRTRMIVRHGMVEDPTEIEEAMEYLALYEKKLSSIPGNRLGFTL